MKNIFVLPANKPSRLYTYKSNELYLNPVVVDATSSNTNCKNQNMYITSDEKIKQGDWYIYDNRIWKMRYPKWRKKGQLEAKKVILTTDPDLIKDAIQAIDNEFLEWFVQNLSCEKVEIKHIIKEYVDDQDAYGYDASYYTIAIPKKEPIHTSYTGKVWEPSKQETVEEAAEKYWSRQPYNEDPFVEGVKWQQERSYSKEEVWKLVNKLNQTLNIGSDLTLEEWFKQFKKK